MDQSTTAKFNLLLRQYALLADEAADVMRLVRDEQNLRLRRDALDLLKSIDTRKLVLLDQLDELMRRAA